MRRIFRVVSGCFSIARKTTKHPMLCPFDLRRASLPEPPVVLELRHACRTLMSAHAYQQGIPLIEAQTIRSALNSW
jgi:hypothetical protein